MVITAPGLSSTTTFQPSPSANALAMMRARMSGGCARRGRHHDANDIRREGLCKCRPKGRAATDRRRSCQKCPPVHAVPLHLLSREASNRFLSLTSESKPTAAIHSRTTLILYEVITFWDDPFHGLGQAHQASAEVARPQYFVG